ncbi:hypothetical protein BCR39DRAFT_288748 [Naematelia encephala]|uniref:Nucleotide-diphospho-sugar transferase n=1 Tax=Naematelia encephala TaxID=71784 RepID=A0A1Y2ASD9_9TREE|nr:hypothetical protein BCR39DRAFT_288748 [Naematelia encephala]
MAHKSDVIRILALREYGGIYMDMDLFAVKPFDDLMYAPATMALQRKAGYDYFCNAFIMAERRSRFMDLWWQSYEHFDHTIWDWNSGAKPFMIAKAFSDDIQALNGSAIFSPLWTDAAKPLVDNDIDFREDGHYAYHGWHRSAVDLFDSLNPRAIREVDTSFNRLVRPYLGEHDDDVWDTIHASP